MRRKSYIYAGWGFALLAIATVSTALPAIASKANTAKTTAVWQDKVVAFEASDQSAKGQTALLSDYYTDAQLTFAKIDADRLNGLTKFSHTDRLVARAEMLEYQCLSDAIYYEARSETLPGQLAVAEVIHNRVKSRHYPNTICGVVYQGAERNTGCQFSFTCDGSMDKAPKGKAWKRSQKAARISLIAAHAPLTDRATHYHTVDVNPKWAPTMRFEKQIGDHVFYSTKWRERPVKSSASMSVAPPS